MICSACNKEARDNAVAYYLMAPQKRPWQDIYTCWTCLTPAEKDERDPSTSDRVRFELIKSLRTK